MPPIVALIACLLFSAYLFKLDSSRENTCSKALWIPVLWFLILASRPITFWLNPSIGWVEGYYTEGNWLDRSVDIILIISSLVILFRRQVGIINIIRNNKFIILYFILCGISIMWSDFPLYSLKRWIKAIGNLVIILIILTETDQLGAINLVIKRCAYILVPLSICLIKYYPSIGRGFSEWTGAATNHGAAMDKNALGKICLVFGLILIHDKIINSNQRREIGNRIYNILQLSIIIMTIWLLIKSASTTSYVSVMLGVTIIASSRLSIFRRNAKYIGIYITIGLLAFYLFDLYFNMTTTILEYLGKDITLTGRTDLWNIVISMVKNPWIGTGYESFWQGSRFAELKEIYWWGPNQAHNGYLEVYLNLGIIGLLSLAALIISSYGKVSEKMIKNYNLGVLSLTFLLVILIHNMTEAGFKGVQLLWNVFLLTVMDVEYRLAVPEADNNLRFKEC